MPEIKLYDERHRISRKRDNGLLRREVWVDHRGVVTRYNLAYINHLIFSGDNGRVLGYDNHHGFHHRHYMGEPQSFDFISFEDVETRFEREWAKLLAV
ncbi:MAG TPA: DUF6516 family protein [Geobacteraceae bacterium]|nr:DUF6516 family protein [Geobacteraceae bacterium]